MYVLAQFSEKSSFEWVARLRAKLDKDELKHADYLHAGLLYSSDAGLWKLIDTGVSEATVFIVDPHTYVMHLLPELINSGAEYGIDFTWKDVLRHAAETMISETPAYELTNSRESMELARLVSSGNPLHGLMVPNCLPLPSEVLKRLGGGVREALRFSARAYAVFDLDMEFSDTPFDTEGYWFRSSPFMTRGKLDMVLRSTLSTRRIFDKEDSRSVRIIAETADTLAKYSYQPNFETLYIKEEDSRNADALQAADIAAGIARTLIDTQGLRALVNKFRRVFVNGINLHSVWR